jgi:hypothetical protein
VCVRIRCSGTWAIDETGFPVGILIQERTPGCGQTGIPVRLHRVQISRQQYGESSAHALGQVRLDQGSCGLEVGQHDLR